MKAPKAIYVWLVPSEHQLDQPGGWRIRKWDTAPFPEANYTLSAAGVAPQAYAQHDSIGEVSRMDGTASPSTEAGTLAIGGDVIEEVRNAWTTINALASPQYVCDHIANILSKSLAQSSTRATTEDVLRAELHRARASYAKAVEILTGIYALLNPPLLMANGKTYSFENPRANETLQALSDAIRAIPEELRSPVAPSAKERDEIIEEAAKCADKVWVEANSLIGSKTARHIADAIRDLKLRSSSTGATNK